MSGTTDQVDIRRFGRATARCLRHGCDYRLEGRFDVVDGRVDGHVAKTGHMVRIRPVNSGTKQEDM